MLNLIHTKESDHANALPIYPKTIYTPTIWTSIKQAIVSFSFRPLSRKPVSRPAPRRLSSLVPCYRPSRVPLDANGDLDWSASYAGNLTTHRRHMNVPCGHCLGCRKATARDWAVRCYHEGLLHTHEITDPVTKVKTQVPNNSVLTLTYNNEHLPSDGLLRHQDYQRFFKRLRKYLDKEVRYFMCGEYGGKTFRAHAHIIIFGHTFNDQYTEQTSPDSTTQMSHELDKLWSQKLTGAKTATNMGRATCDSLTYDGAAYVAGYVAKKLEPHSPISHYITQVDPKTGEVRYIEAAPEYRRMSTGRSAGGGIGGQWINRPENMLKTYEHDCLRIGEFVFHPPKYYDTQLKAFDKELHAKVVQKRKDKLQEHVRSWNHDRCAAAETIAYEALPPRHEDRKLFP